MIGVNPAMTFRFVKAGVIKFDFTAIHNRLSQKLKKPRAQLGDLQRKFSEHVSSLCLRDSDTAETAPGIENFQKFLADFLGWPYELLVGVDPSKLLPESLYVSLPEFQETLRPSFAVKRPPAQIENRKSEIVNSEWLLLVQSHPS